MNIREGLTYDDIMLVQQPSDIKSRKDVDTSTELGDLFFWHPLIAANMSNVMSTRMAYSIIDSGGLAILHRFQPYEDQIKQYQTLKAPDHVSISLGINDEARNAVKDIINYTDCKILTVDIAHGGLNELINFVHYIKSFQKPTIIIAGNVGTTRTAYQLYANGVDAVKVGLSMGSICSTAVQTGFGSPMVTALNEINEMRNHLFPDRQIIADGGIKNSGDMVKSLALGADFVMAGRLFAGCDEAPGTRVEYNKKLYKEYNGSSTHKNKNIEGVKARIECTKSYKLVLKDLLDGIKSGCSYAGVGSVMELRDEPEFYRISTNTLHLSHPHDIVLT